MILDVQNKSLVEKEKSIYQKLIQFCKANPVSLSEIRGDSRKHIIVEYRTRFAKQLYPEYNYSEIARFMDKDPSTIYYWLNYRTPLSI